MLRSYPAHVTATVRLVSVCPPACLPARLSVCLPACLSVYRYTNSENRPDIVAFDPVDYSSADLDVSMAHPLSGDSMKGAAAESGYAAKKREMKKEQKYNQQVYQSGSRLSFVPLVFEHYGYWGPSAEDYLDCI